jgi:endonuclease-3
VAAASPAEHLEPADVDRILARLAGAYPEAECELDHDDPWQLLVATVLSAQCTDQRVNRVTPELFRRWPGPSELADADLAELETVIRSTGLFRSKARNLRQTARLVTADHGGEVPRSADELVALPGVGRKTANVVLGEAYGVASGIAVDTHVQRLARRIGLTSADGADRVADDLEQLIAREHWIDVSKRLILHGRRICSARGPRCDDCVLVGLCQRNGL